MLDEVEQANEGECLSLLPSTRSYGLSILMTLTTFVTVEAIPLVWQNMACLTE